MNMQLSEHFSLEEFTRSAEAGRLGLSNAPSAAHLTNLRWTAELLEEVRTRAGGRAMTIHSGYRAPAVNAAVGGVPTSAHALGYAADITVEGMTALDLCELIAESGIAFDQVIYEKSRGICHVSFDPRCRNECKTQAAGPGSTVVWGLHA
jgi:zinc D-Ala-D-Ala carboxypeptidase